MTRALLLSLWLVGGFTTWPVSAQDSTTGSAAAGAGNRLSDQFAVDPITGFRLERYRAPVPADVPGGVTIDTSAALTLHHDQGAVFIDVYPPTGLGPDPLDGHWVTDESRESIPGAVWLPEVGRGTLDTDATDYFRRNLAGLTRNDTTAPVVFFCTADCWQSWNAARRAILWGYSAVHWYPLGTDGWLELGLELETVQPVNFLDDTIPELSQQGQSWRFPTRARIYLQDLQGSELDIGQVEFSPGTDGKTTVDVDIDSPVWVDQFLSMRPFRCLTDAAEWFCHLPYPYELKGVVSANDLTELEYQLLFIWKSPKSFGIDAWNGVYYRLTTEADGSLTGDLLQGDLNVLADPPEPYSHPIDLTEFISGGADNRLYPSLVIRP